ncbi:GNAT family N-acetyltransferase [Nocardioides seonyuensis]|uniref:GNAT family N-acetyltransferase n=1 Tax=Nocardioides seonyuensis TaxID=2518371 RepID=A0A4P7IE29_9ACTN|nr:GNAT family N-acetyltransferase [Nocardioides seonyuensis]QBX55464.1 GNAT family N-acetyltransferase [Nocardioides seonyuensis]
METLLVARPSHAEVVGQLLRDFNDEFETAGPPAADLARRFRALLEREDVLVLLAGSEGAWTGFAYLTLRPTPYYDGRLAQLEELYVVPWLRDRGIGTALLTEAVRIVRERGGAEMHINVDEVDTDTRRFYERHGFVNIEPGEDYRMLCYIRELAR